MICHQLTSNDVLNIFIEQHRLTSPYDPEADSSIELSFSSTIDEWRKANDLLAWEPLSEYLNQKFQISPSPQEWKEVLTPAYKKDLESVCELISQHYTKEDLVYLKPFGQECISVTIFKKLMSSFESQGIETSDIKPSTELSPYLDKYFSDIIFQILILSKGKRIFEEFEIDIQREDSSKKGIFRFISFFSVTRCNFKTGNILTFGDLVNKIIKVNEYKTTPN